jgi:hypothetical protein
LFQFSTGQAIKDEIINPFSDKDEVFAVIRETRQCRSDFFIHIAQNDASGLFGGVFSGRLDCSAEGKLCEKVANDGSEEDAKQQGKKVCFRHRKEN